MLVPRRVITAIVGWVGCGWFLFKTNGLVGLGLGFGCFVFLNPGIQ